MRIFSLLFIFTLEVVAGEAANAKIIDASNSIFLSAKLQKQMGDHELFPAFWWDYLVLNVTSDADWTKASAMCKSLKNQAPKFIIEAQCQEDFGDLINLTRDWARDLPLRRPAPSNYNLVKSLNHALARASLPMVGDSFVSLLRADPMESWKELKALAEKKVKVNLHRDRGFFFDEKEKQIVIPIQFSFPPSEVGFTARFKESVSLDENKFFLIGPHGGCLQNQEQIMRDLHHVSWIGLGLLCILGFLLIWRQKSRVLLLVPAVFIAMCISTFFTVLIYGSIHGLTLSFGTAIVGLALDYGLQGVFNGRSPHLWRSNSFGLATTLVGLCVLLFSEIPLVQQMMVFSIIGLTTAFGFFYYLISRRPKTFIVDPFNLKPRMSRERSVVSIVLAFSSLMAFWVITPTTDLSKFDYQTPESFKIMKHLFTVLDVRPPLFSITESSDAFRKAIDEKAWSIKSSIEVENLTNYIMPVEVQKKNRNSWILPQCSRLQQKATGEQVKFFSPFFEALCQTSLIDPGFYSWPRSYLDHLHGGNRWLTLWLPKTEGEERQVREKYPEVISLREIVTEIPKTLSQDLKWMAPLAILLAGLILFSYYRSFLLTLSALIPFFTGIGLVSLGVLVLRFDISFVTIISLVMIFGFSIDYGIFATDVNRGLREQSEEGVWTGLTFAILATCAGFFPLIFCKHPILLGLGRTLFIGGLGTYIGAIWGIPAFSKWKGRE